VAGSLLIAKAPVDPAREDDSALVKRCLDGDQRAWADLLERYKRLIFSVPLRHGLTRDEAGDVFQSVCLDLFVSLAHLRAVEALPKWLMEASYHRTLYHQRQRRQMDGDLSEEQADTAAMPDALVHDVERAQLVREAVARLPERCAELVHLLFFTMPAQPYAKIARKLSLATGSIGFIRGRCLERLRCELEKAGFS
jgi:RNA polymerase sigma factor (sigma-70 family)